MQAARKVRYGTQSIKASSLGLSPNSMSFVYGYVLVGKMVIERGRVGDKMGGALLTYDVNAVRCPRTKYFRNTRWSELCGPLQLLQAKKSWPAELGPTGT